MMAQDRKILIKYYCIFIAIKGRAWVEAKKDASYLTTRWIRVEWGAIAEQNGWTAHQYLHIVKLLASWVKGDQYSDYSDHPALLFTVTNYTIQH